MTIERCGPCFLRLHYIQAGRVRIENDSTGELIFNKGKGDFLGEWSVLGDWQWVQLPGEEYACAVR